MNILFVPLSVHSSSAQTSAALWSPRLTYVRLPLGAHPHIPSPYYYYFLFKFF